MNLPRSLKVSLCEGLFRLGWPNERFPNCPLWPLQPRVSRRKTLKPLLRTPPQDKCVMTRWERWNVKWRDGRESEAEVFVLVKLETQW